MSDEGKSRGFCFTTFNYDEIYNKIASFVSTQGVYSIIGKEICPTTKRPHLQGYVYFKNERYFNAIRKKIPNSNIKIALGTAKHNQTYCSKEGNFQEWGTCPQQGKRNDLIAFRDAILNGASEESLILDHAESFAKYDRFYQRVRNLVLKKEARKMITPEVNVIIGTTGTGKTHGVYANNDIEDIYKVEVGDGSSGSIFWDSYNGESVILIDDFHNNFKLDYMLRLLDKYPMKLNIKGGHTWKCAKKIYITSNINFNNWYPNCPQVHRDALRRRITNITNQMDSHDLITQHNMLDELRNQ